MSAQIGNGRFHGNARSHSNSVADDWARLDHYLPEGYAMQRNGVEQGIAGLCIGGGEAIAVAIARSAA